MRVAMLSVHACPMAKLGGRDSGGMNVYIRELARDLARRGIEVDVYTRQREHDLRYDVIHAHYWLSAEVARVLAPKWGVPRIQMFHTLGLVKREVMDEDVDAESDVRIAIERRAVQESAAVVAASEIEASELE